MEGCQWPDIEAANWKCACHFLKKPKSVRYPSLMPINFLPVYRIQACRHLPALPFDTMTAVGSICHGPRIKAHLQTPWPRRSCLGGVFPGWAYYIGAWIPAWISILRRLSAVCIRGFIVSNSCRYGLSHKPNDLLHIWHADSRVLPVIRLGV